jgi:hypothetical protein
VEISGLRMTRRQWERALARPDFGVVWWLMRQEAQASGAPNTNRPASNEGTRRAGSVRDGG